MSSTKTFKVLSHKFALAAQGETITAAELAKAGHNAAALVAGGHIAPASAPAKKKKAKP